MLTESVGSVVFRPYTQDDVPFIMDSWGSSYYRGRKAHRKLSPEEFHSFHRPTRERFFTRPNTCIIVAAEPQNDNWLILGWIAVEVVASGFILHYIYVRKTMKHEGIAEELMKRAIPSMNVFYSHVTDKAQKIISNHPEQFQRFQYVPSLV